MPPPAAVRIRELTKRFRRADGSIVHAIEDVSLDVHVGEFVVLLGPSGCGKTTLLRTIAGLERPDSGVIEVGKQVVFDSAARVDVPIERRSISMVFQSYALWPHMTAFDNVAYPLRCRSVRKQEIRDRVQRALALVGISELSGQHPNQMSGGQQQRLALARALVVEGGLILFDEPLSNVDARVREQLRFELLEMHRELGFTAVYVTHDQLEAMELATRIAVMQAGRIAQLAPPRESYSSPVSRYVATFLGAANEVNGIVKAQDGGWSIVGDETVVLAASNAVGLADGDDAVAILRPEHCEISRAVVETPNSWRGKVHAVLYLGQYCEYVIEVGTPGLFRARSARDDLAVEGDEVWLHVDPANVRLVRP